ncbi:methylenetetrahydrofolate--tRNA-(uracil(54)-C(5))-methyltransferase (FADH(2)-oxidizing) TrmFO [bacterium]|nr:methylenetetrahydrofolate--tRNA-(uracil(54)-C(5))-methyltransferase (FADH(2)-oxidizing) TrmFO [bacterium]
MSDFDITIIGAGMAGSEAAQACARAGIRVRLVERKPAAFSPAHNLPGPAEMVCSNSFGSLDPHTGSGLLKREMDLLGSILLDAGRDAAVPAGGSLAVDRAALSDHVRARLADFGVSIETGEPDRLPDSPAIVATGPLTADDLAADLARVTGSEHLFFFDATSPIVAGESIDRSVVYAASRWDKGEPDFLNCPMTEEQYAAFLAALREAEKVTPREFEGARLFEACQPIEDLAARGDKTLAFGPMRPVGLVDPRTGRRPHAVVQLRREDADGESWSIVGFQTRMKHGDQKRVLRMIPGLANAQFHRLGVIHRNTYVDGPRVLDETLRLRARPLVRLAGQITGVEGYLESGACGLLAGLFAAAQLRGVTIPAPGPATMLGALLRHVTASDARPFMPMNANFGLLPAIEGRAKKADRKAKKSERALSEGTAWAATVRERLFGEAELSASKAHL